MPNNLSFNNTQNFRDALLKRNLPDSYGVSDTLPVNFTDSTYILQNLSDSSVIDQQDITTSSAPIIDNIGTLNMFGPETYNPTTISNYIKNTGTQYNYGENFEADPNVETLGLISILTGSDTGEGDSDLVQIARKQLRNLALSTMGVKLDASTLGRVNALDAINDPDALVGLLTGREPIIERDYQITVPGNPITKAAEYFARISGTQLPVSYIPGNFFEENVDKGRVEGFLDKAGQAVGQVLNLDFTSHKKTYSQKLLQYTSGGQKSKLFKSVNYNKYKPNYDTSVGGVVNNVIGFVQGLAGLDPTDGFFYLGSGDVDPGTIFSYDTKSNSEKGYMVSGPSKMVKMFEGDTPLNTFPENDRTYLNGTAPKNTETQFIWLGDSDNVRGTIDGVGVQSNEKTLRDDSLLGKTQQMVQDASALDGESRLKHPGSAISNVAYKYHDGYKIISKGNAVRGEDDDFCRVWTKDYGYDRYGRMVRYKGIQDTQRRIPGSVIKSQMMLNIAPTRDSDGKPINFGVDESGKNLSKYMFSIENLAWAGSDKIKERPICEQGPNGGRIMWFPPYDLKYTDDNRANWTSHTFLGRPEPIYTYNNAERSGTLSFKVVVDHPSIFNFLRKKYEKGYTSQQKQEIMDSFIAGCKDFDIYDLVNYFDTLSYIEATTLETFLNQNANGELKFENRINVPAEIISGETSTVTEIEPEFKKKYGKDVTNIQLYWFNDIPGPQNKVDKEPNSKFEDDLSSYIAGFNTSGSTGSYIEKATRLTGSTETIAWEIADLESFGGKLTEIQKTVEEIKDTVQKTLKQHDLFTFQITIESTTSAVATQEYNDALASRRAESLKAYLLGDDFADQKDRIKIKLDAIGENTNPEFAGFNCNTLQDSNNNGVDARIYSRSATYCRTAKATIQVLGNPTEVNTNPAVYGDPRVDYDVTKQPFQYDPEFNDPINILLKTMHSECDYFYELKETDPLVFDNLIDKLKYFQPGFHSTTPEGLNKRLTFLQQCLRPGETVKVYDETNNEINNISSNTSFGRPPICVLRIGDFFHTKMVVDSINFTYDDSLWDMNPEGIGMQPMIASVNMGVKFIGGHGISNVINELQNALSFNYYANTEVYDEMATKTDGGRDKEYMSTAANKVKSVINDKLTEKLVNALNDKEQSPDNDEYWGNLSEKDPNLITYNQFYNDFVDKVNDYVCQVTTEIGNLTNKYGKSAIYPLFQTKERYNITSTIRTSTTESVDIKFIGNTTYDYNEHYSKVLANVRTHINSGDITTNPSYKEIKKKINFNKNKEEDFIKISNYILDEVEANFGTFGLEINQALSNIHEKHKSLQKVMDAMDIILGDEIDGYSDNGFDYTVKFLNNLTADNGDMSEDVNNALTSLKKYMEGVTSIPEPRGLELEYAKESELISVEYFYQVILPFYLRGNMFDLDAAVANNRVRFDNIQVKKEFEKYIQTLKNTPIPTNYDINLFIWNDITHTKVLFDYRLTDTINPANEETLKEYYDTINVGPSVTKANDSKFCWKRAETIALKPKGISPFEVQPKGELIPLSLYKVNQ